METLIRNALGNYTNYAAEAKLQERWLVRRDDSAMRDDLAFLQMKVTAIQSWLDLLSADERFVVEKHLIDKLEWPRVAFEFAERWKGEFTRTERTLVHYQACALKKIIDFCNVYKDITVTLFGNIDKQNTNT